LIPHGFIDIAALKHCHHCSERHFNCRTWSSQAAAIATSVVANQPSKKQHKSDESKSETQATRASSQSRKQAVEAIEKATAALTSPPLTSLDKYTTPSKWLDAVGIADNIKRTSLLELVSQEYRNNVRAIISLTEQKLKSVLNEEEVNMWNLQKRVDGFT
jgi:hypothetical protein